MSSFVDRMSLCIWGDGPRRPHDNAYILIRKEVDAENKIITLYFDGNEKCTIFNPIDIEWKGMRLKVKSADKIIWEHYYYGKPQTPETLCVYEYTFVDSAHVHVVEKSNWTNRDEVFSPKGNAAINTV